jgi:hypothetical protein
LKITKFTLDKQAPFNIENIVSTAPNKPIYIGLPFSGYPSLEEGIISFSMNSLLIDSNIFGDIWQGRNKSHITELMRIIQEKQLNISFNFAATELYLNYHAPDEAMREFIEALYRDYQCQFPLDKFEAYKNLIKCNLMGIKENISLIRDYLVIVKNIFLHKSGVKKHVEMLTEVIKYNNLPQFGFITLLSLVLFYARKNQSQFDSTMISKIDKDMQLKGSRREEEELLDNVARDLALFIACSESFYHFLDNANEICWLASGDATVGLMLQEIEYYRFEYKEIDQQTKDTKFTAHLRLKKSGKSYETLQPLIEKYWDKNLNALSFDEKSIGEKRRNLKAFSNSIMNNYQWSD